MSSASAIIGAGAVVPLYGEGRYGLAELGGVGVSDRTRTADLDVCAGARRSRWIFLLWINGPALALAAAVIVADHDRFAWVALAALVVLVFVLDWLAARGRTWIESSVLWQRRIGTRRADVARAVSVQLCCDNRCGTRLIVTDETGDTASAELLSLPPGRICGAAPDALQHLALALARAPAPGAAALGRLLRRQSEWIAAGGSLRTSPLMPFATGEYGRLVEAAETPGLIAGLQGGDSGQRSSG